MSESKKKKSLLSKYFYIEGQTDIVLLCTVILTLCVGLVCLWSASYPVAINEGKASYAYVLKQGIYAALGVFAMLLVSRIDYDILKRNHIPIILLIVSIALIVIPIIQGGNGNKRWITLGSFQFQPSEILKFAFILYLSFMVDKYHRQISRKRTIKDKKDFLVGIFWAYVPSIGPFVAAAFILLWQPHLSCTILIAVIVISMMFVGGVRPLYFIVPIIAGAIAFVIFVSGGYFADRISAWFHPFDYAKTTGWQIVQSLYAIASGGLLGVGLGNSRLKYLYLPEPENDFIFSVICEELGFVGALFIIIMFCFLVYCGIHVAARARDRFGTMLAFGITVQIGIQTMINIGVVTGTFPNTGISMPFFSSGGTSLVMLLAEVGVMLSVARKSNIKKLG